MADIDDGYLVGKATRVFSKCIYIFLKCYHRRMRVLYDVQLAQLPSRCAARYQGDRAGYKGYG